MGRRKVDVLKLLRKTAEQFRADGNKYRDDGMKKEDVQFLGVGQGHYACARTLEKLADAIEGKDDDSDTDSDED